MSATGRFIFHPITRDKINEGLLNFWGWLLPERGGLVENLLGFWGVVLVLILLGLAGWAIIAAVRELQRKDKTAGGGIFAVLRGSMPCRRYPIWQYCCFH